MQSSKAVAIGIVVLVVAAVAGLGIWNATNNDDDQQASTSQTTNQTEQTTEETAMEQMNITELASGTESLSTLVAALKAAGLAETLAAPDAQFTVFAPANDAFTKLPAGTVDSLLLPENKQLLTTVLTYHVVPSAALAASLTNGQKLTTVQGQELTVGVQDGKVSITDVKGGVAQVTTADVKASNGVVHIIDTVLMPQ